MQELEPRPREAGPSSPETEPKPGAAGDAGGADAAENEALRFAIAAARIAAANKTEDVEVLDLRGLSSFADFFVLGTGTSDRQMHAVADFIEEHAAKEGRQPFKRADARTAAWILADYIDVVVHLFDTQHRDYYDLSNLWGEAPRVDWQRSA